MPDRSERLGLSVGDRILLQYPHPWAGTVGDVVEIAPDPIGGGKDGAVVRLDGQAGAQAGVTERSDFTHVEGGSRG